jgi:hypothetical protein
MLTKNDIITFDCKEDWLRKGLDYALISWTSTFNRMQKPNPYVRMQNIIKGLIAENSFENYLKDENISFHQKGKTRWYNADRYDIGIDNYAIDVKSSFIDPNTKYYEKKINEYSDSKYDWIINFNGLVPSDQFNKGENRNRRAHERNKIYVFSCLEGFFSENEINNPIVHAFWDYQWLKKKEYAKEGNLGPLEVRYYKKNFIKERLQAHKNKDKNKSENKIIIYGTTKKGEKCIETLHLNSVLNTTVNDFFQVFSVEYIGEGIPDRKIEIVSSSFPELKETIYPELSYNIEKVNNGYLLHDNNWQSLKIHKGKIYLLGWIFEEKLRVIGKEFPRFSKDIEQYQEIKVDNFGCNVTDLEPIKSIKSL